MVIVGRNTVISCLPFFASEAAAVALGHALLTLAPVFVAAPSLAHADFSFVPAVQAALLVFHSFSSISFTHSAKIL